MLQSYMGTGGGTARTYRWIPTFFPKIPVLKGTVLYLGTVNFFAHESHCTSGTKNFSALKAPKKFFLLIHFQFVPMVHFFSTFNQKMYQGYTFFPTFNQKMYQWYRFFYTKFLGVPAVQFFWPLLATFSHFLVIFGQKLRKFFHFVLLVHFF